VVQHIPNDHMIQSITLLVGICCPIAVCQPAFETDNRERQAAAAQKLFDVCASEFRLTLDDCQEAVNLIREIFRQGVEHLNDDPLADHATLGELVLAVATQHQFRLASWQIPYLATHMLNDRQLQREEQSAQLAERCGDYIGAVRIYSRAIETWSLRADNEHAMDLACALIRTAALLPENELRNCLDARVSESSHEFRQIDPGLEHEICTRHASELARLFAARPDFWELPPRQMLNHSINGLLVREFIIKECTRLKRQLLGDTDLSVEEYALLKLSLMAALDSYAESRKRLYPLAVPEPRLSDRRTDEHRERFLEQARNLVRRLPPRELHSRALVIPTDPDDENLRLLERACSFVMDMPSAEPRSLEDLLNTGRTLVENFVTADHPKQAIRALALLHQVRNKFLPHVEDWDKQVQTRLTSHELSDARLINLLRNGPWIEAVQTGLRQSLCPIAPRCTTSAKLQIYLSPEMKILSLDCYFQQDPGDSAGNAPVESLVRAALTQAFDGPHLPFPSELEWSFKPTVGHAHTDERALTENDLEIWFSVVLDAGSVHIKQFSLHRPRTRPRGRSVRTKLR
jgi:hypothetical protein